MWYSGKMDNNDLLKQKCVPCEGGAMPMNKDEVDFFMKKVSGWSIGAEYKKISKTYKFKDFVEAIEFVKKVADIAESEGHHPDIQINYNKVNLDLWTHAIGGLSQNDFIVAAKVDAIA